MPSQGNAPLQPLQLVGPGFYGLNKQASSSILPAQWAGEAQNVVFDDASRLAARKGWLVVTVTPLAGTPAFGQIFEYKPTSPTVNKVVSAANNKLYVGTQTLADITGTLTITANNWKFVNFNGNVYGLQTGHPLIVYTGTGTFTAVVPASGTVPAGNELLSAFGRLWGVDSDKQTLKYSFLLDATNWTGVGAGSINFTNVWPGGADEITAVTSFNNRLVVFGKRHIIFLGDTTTGSVLGLNPSNTIVTDMIPGIGCVERDSVQTIAGDDMCFLSHAGVQSLSRAIQERSPPKHDLSRNIRDYMLASYTGITAGTARSCYSPRNGLYLLSFPGQKVFAFDTRIKLDDESWRVTEWNTTIPTSLCALEDGITIYQGSVGQIFQYSGYQDNLLTYRMVYQSGWLDLGQDASNYLKILKRISAVIFFQSGASILFKWAFDFSTTFNSFTRTTAFDASGGEWGLGEWGLMEWGGQTGLQTLRVPGLGTGQYIKVGVEVDVNSSVLAIQQLELYAKTGRLA